MPKLEDHELENAKFIIAAAKSDKFKKVFFLGPYARRVTFAAQQNRALNLVWALHGSGEIEPPSDIAVVGAGLSGLTTCAALAELGYAPYLYEKASEPLHRQSSTMHRFIHPTINEWPEKVPHPTTTVPYFDWFSNLCQPLMEELEAEWAERVEANSIEYIKNCEVQDFTEAGGLVTLQTKNNNRFAGRPFKAVIVTSGFSDEIGTEKEGLPPYWRSDHVEDDIRGGNVSRFYISGCGDGGLIDALRVAHRKFRAGRLAIELAAELSALRWAPSEDIAREEDALFTDKARFASAVKEGSEALQNVYRDAAKQLPDTIIARLGKLGDDPEKVSLRVDQTGFATLITRERYPFSPMSAPIHKLLIAHAMINHVVKHEQGEVGDSTKSEISYLPPGGDPKNKKDWKKLKGRVILRHGAKPNFAAFLGEGQSSAQLIERQRILAADLDRPLWSSGQAPLRRWPPAAPPYDIQELRRRRKHARLIVEDLEGVSFDIHVDYGFMVFHRTDAEIEAKVSKLPDTLFGFPLRKWKQDQQPEEPAGAYGFLGWRKSARDVEIGPGSVIHRSMDGRLGPIVSDASGALFGLTASHVLFSASTALPPDVTGAGDIVIGEPVGVDGARLDDNEHIALVRLSPGLRVKTEYAGGDAITGFVHEDDRFGAIALIQSIDGSIQRGYVSATRAAVRFPHPGLGRYVTVRDAIRVTSALSGKPFSKPGDSGAPVVDHKGKLLGIVISGEHDFTYLICPQTFLAERELTLLKKTRKPERDVQLETNDIVRGVARLHRGAFNQGSISLPDDTVPGDGDAPPVFEDFPESQEP